MTTAFQPDAFQNNAFQIDVTTDTHDGVDGFKKSYLPIYVGRGHKKQKLGNVLRVYSDARREKPEAKRLLSLVDSYIEPINEAEQEKRNNAKFIVDDLPDLERINIAALVQNQMALDILLSEIGRIENQIKDRNADDDLLFMLAAIV